MRQERPGTDSLLPRRFGTVSFFIQEQLMARHCLWSLSRLGPEGNDCEEVDLGPTANGRRFRSIPPIQWPSSRWLDSRFTQEKAEYKVVTLIGTDLKV